jgi:hypothetical protein
MKFLSLILLSVLVVACGASNGKNKSERSEPQLNPDPECRGSIQSKSALCLPLAKYTITSSKPFPKKMKITFVLDGDNNKYDAFNSCGQYIPKYSIVRSGPLEHFKIIELKALSMHAREIEILDLGEKCDNDAIFIQQSLSSISIQVEGQMAEVSYVLQN